MRRYSAVTILLLLFAVPCFAGINVNGSADLVNGSNAHSIQGNFPMAMGGWVFVNSFNSDGDGLVSNGGFAGGVGRGWILEVTDTFNCGDTVITFIKGGSTDDFVCSHLTAPLGAWVFIAAVVTSNNVHFVLMTAAGSITEEDVSDSTTFTATTDVTGIGGSTHISGTVFLIHGILANVFVFGTSSLTNNELKAVARGGPLAVGHPLTLFVPAYFDNAAHGNADIAHGFYTMLQTSGTGISANQCPCGWPTGEGH